MKANRITVREVCPDYWELDFVGNCGDLMFQSVITVHDARSINPGIKVEKPFGLRGMKQALRIIEEKRSEYGLTTLQ